jgi:hypothetical protein
MPQTEQGKTVMRRIARRLSLIRINLWYWLYQCHRRVDDNIEPSSHGFCGRFTKAFWWHLETFEEDLDGKVYPPVVVK